MGMVFDQEDYGLEKLSVSVSYSVLRCWLVRGTQMVSSERGIAGRETALRVRSLMIVPNPFLLLDKCSSVSGGS